MQRYLKTGSSTADISDNGLEKKNMIRIKKQFPLKFKTVTAKLFG